MVTRSSTTLRPLILLPVPRFDTLIVSICTRLLSGARECKMASIGHALSMRIKHDFCPSKIIFGNNNNRNGFQPVFSHIEAPTAYTFKFGTKCVIHFTCGKFLSRHACLRPTLSSTTTTTFPLTLTRLNCNDDSRGLLTPASISTFRTCLTEYDMAKTGAGVMEEVCKQLA